MSNKALNVLIIIGVLNFIAFAVGSLVIGGDALNGHVANGHYFVSNHGQLTEVSQAVFAYSRWHALSLLLTHPIAIIALIMRSLRRKKTRMGK